MFEKKKNKNFRSKNTTFRDRKNNTKLHSFEHKFFFLSMVVDGNYYVKKMSFSKLTGLERSDFSIWNNFLWKFNLEIYTLSWISVGSFNCFFEIMKLDILKLIFDWEISWLNSLQHFPLDFRGLTGQSLKNFRLGWNVNIEKCSRSKAGSDQNGNKTADN